MTVGAVGLITNVLREHTACIGMSGPDTWFYPSCEGCQWTESKVRTGDEALTLHAEHVAREVDAALGGLTREPDRTTKCVCRHPVTDHDSGQRCHANSGSRHTPCTCIEWRPRHRSRWVSSYSEDEQ